MFGKVEAVNQFLMLFILVVLMSKTDEITNNVEVMAADVQKSLGEEKGYDGC